MTDKTNKPVIFLAFANDRNGTVGQPLNLPEEERRVRETLEAAQGLCEFVARSHCTADDIFKVLQNARYRDRIAIFHFSGHANSFQLLLETRDGQAAAADASGLASFLASQHGLRLVFLNGCSTRQQAQGLLDANKNLAAVIATSRAIDDRVALDFSKRFYAALAQGTTSIRIAFNEACAAITTTRGSDHRKLYFGDHHSLPEDNRSSDGAPWVLYERKGSEVVDQWSLSHAANDPLFGLPPPDETNLTESPYKHLNWFTKDDAEIFFGRGRQIREMYDALSSGSQPVILFYGQSGVGKSSLLNAGVLPRLTKSCEIRYERRGDRGLLATLKKALGLAADDAIPIETAWRASEAEPGKPPLIVILDQVEECYTRPILDLPDELAQLLRAVEATFGDPAQRPRGKLVLSFREEWLALLEDEVKTFHLPFTKIFLKPLDRDGIIEVVEGPTRSRRLRERYALTIDDRLAGEIADRLLADRGSAIATTLQILLSKLWDKATEIRSEPPTFTRDLYLDLKDKGILLSDFLGQQLKAFAAHMPEPAKSGLLLDVLARHTTDLGTASQSSLKQLEQEYSHVSDRLPGLLKHCKDLYLLTTPQSGPTSTSDTTRLAHDTLAPLVRAEFDKSDKPGQRARRILDNRTVDWADGKTGTPLGDADLKIVEEGRTGTRDWKPDVERLIRASRQAKETHKRAVLDQMQREEKLRKVVLDTTKQRELDAQVARINAEKSEKKIRSWFHLAAALLVVATALGAFGWWNYKTAEERKNELTKTNSKLTIQTERANTNADNATAQKHKAEATSSHLQANLYKLDMRTAYEAWQNSNLRRAVVLLEKYRPAAHSNELDLRDFEWYHLWTLINRADATFWGHTSYITAVGFLPESDLCYSAGYDGTIRIWNSRRGGIENIIDVGERGSHYSVSAVAVSEIGNTLAAATSSAISVRERSTFKETHSLDAGNYRDDGNGSGASSPAHVLITSDAKRLVCSSLFGLKVWDLTTSPSNLIAKLDDSITGMACSPDGKLLAAIWIVNAKERENALFDETPEAETAIKILDVTTLELITTIETESKGFSQVAFSNDGKHILASTRKRIKSDSFVLEDAEYSLEEWDLETHQRVHTIPCGTSSIESIAVHPDGLHAATGNRQGKIHVWTLDPPLLQNEFLVHSDSVSCLAFSKDGGLLLSGSIDGSCKILHPLEVEHPALFARSEAEVALLKISPNGKHFFAIFEDKHMYVWDFESQETLDLGEVHAGEADWPEIQMVAFSPDGKHLAVVRNTKALEPGFVDVFDLSNGEIQFTLTGHTNEVRCVAYSPTGALIATGAKSQEVMLWNSADGTREGTLVGHDVEVATLAFRNEQTLASAGGYYDKPGEIIFWNLHTKRIRQRLSGHSKTVYSVGFGPQNTFASLSEDGTLRLWDSDTGLERASVPSHVTGGSPQLFAGVIFAPTAQPLVTVNTDSGNVTVWNGFNGEIAGSLPQAPSFAVTSVAFSPDGNDVITSSLDGYTIWDCKVIESRVEASQNKKEHSSIGLSSEVLKIAALDLPSFRGYVRPLTISGPNNSLIVAGKNGTVHGLKLATPSAVVNPAVRFKSDLAHPSPTTRRNAAEALGKLPVLSESAIGHLESGLMDRDAKVRESCANTLFLYGSAAKLILPSLVSTIEQDSNVAVAYAAYRAAERIDAGSQNLMTLKKAVIRGLATKDDTSHWEWDNLVAPDGGGGGLWKIREEFPDMISELRNALRKTNRMRLRERLVWALEQLGPKAAVAVPDLEKLLDGDDHKLRYRAAIAIVIVGEGKTASPEVVTALNECLNQPPGQYVSSIHIDAAEAVKQLGPKGVVAVPGLLTWLRARKSQAATLGFGSEIRYAAAALGSIGPGAKDAIPDLIEMLQHEYPVGPAAQGALSKIGVAAVPSLEVALAGDNLESQMRAARALGAIGPPANMALESIRKASMSDNLLLRVYCWYAITKISLNGDATERQLIEVLNNPMSDSDARSAAAWAIGEMGTLSQEGRDSLIKGLKEDDASLVLACARGLKDWQSATSSVIDAVLQNPGKHKDKWIRVQAVTFLGQLGSAATSAVPRLEKMLEDDSPDVRSAVSQAIDKITGVQEAAKKMK
ncbi:nSTAND1 domain-containing NTPase [Allorhodopirellula solitaria]|uniref:WD domain, G-beta repeat n=1 Tax=Allorhodopirellula solitaria TaxID=2527987 RepID=A0A5C5WY84_9BACT|nr:CHAT domain-containing protein [Allorhodopirellula solitaria]TWT55540.1 WD domain, G-beta repeat [Allorhodopirellula solitaria]